MNRLTWLGVCCTLLAAASLAGPTAGYDAASADRGLNVDVVDDDRAELGVETHATPKYGCGAEVTVTNRFATPIETVTIDGGHQGQKPGLTHETATVDDLAPGETETVTVSLDKFAKNPSVAVDADGESASVELVRTVDTRDVPACNPRNERHAPNDENGRP